VRKIAIGERTRNLNSRHQIYHPDSRPGNIEDLRIVCGGGGDTTVDRQPAPFTDPALQPRTTQRADSRALQLKSAQLTDRALQLKSTPAADTRALQLRATQVADIRTLPLRKITLQRKNSGNLRRTEVMSEDSVAGGVVIKQEVTEEVDRVVASVDNTATSSHLTPDTNTYHTTTAQLSAPEHDELLEDLDFLLEDDGPILPATESDGQGDDDLLDELDQLIDHS